jgi:hypothetical protein
VFYAGDEVLGGGRIAAAAGSGAVCREVSVTTQYVTVTQKSASAASVSKRV